MALGSQHLALHGVDPLHENVAAPVYYATNGGPRGIDVGPQSIPKASDLDLTYATARHQTIWEYAPKSRGAEDYGAFLDFVQHGRSIAQREAIDGQQEEGSVF
jgi:hypothetical protein